MLETDTTERFTITVEFVCAVFADLHQSLKIVVNDRQPTTVFESVTKNPFNQMYPAGLDHHETCLVYYDLPNCNLTAGTYLVLSVARP